VIDPEALAQFTEIIRAGGVIVCAPDVARWLEHALPPDVLARFGDRLIAHPWLNPGEIAAVSPGAVIVRPIDDTLRGLDR
jgi:hypothetical protein